MLGPLLVGLSFGAEIVLTATDGQSGDGFGYAVAAAPDTGRGIELLIGAPWADDRGAVYWLVGETELRWTAQDGESGDGFGKAVATGGDIDGDGLLDALVGAPDADPHGDGSGAAYLRLADGREEIIVPMRGESGVEFGAAVAMAGDTNGDGYDDVLIGAPSWHDSNGVAYLYHGSVVGTAPDTEFQLNASDASYQARFGEAVAGVGDQDGDGLDEVLIGAPMGENGGSYSGAAYLYFGTNEGPSYEVILANGGLNSRFAASVSRAGDIDRDGYQDFVVGAAAAGSGEVCVYTEGGSVEQCVYAGAGDITAAAGDINGDNFDDLIVGSGRSCRFTACFGGENELSMQSGAAHALESCGSEDVTALTTADDWDRDGFDDVAFGVPSAGEGGAVVIWTGCRDTDRDGTCAEDDCDDSSSRTFPGAAFHDSSSACMADADHDGYGDDDPPPGVTPGSDCDDTHPGAHPGAAIWENHDNSCMIDADGDGWGAAEPDRGIVGGTDCDDGDSSAFPGAAARDSTTSCMVDADEDGFGDDAPAAGVTPGTDCDDSDETTFIGVAPADSGVACMKDTDGDRYGDATPPPSVTPGTDCDDEQREVFPDHPETPADGVDSNCDGWEICIADADRDGYASEFATVFSSDVDCDEPGVSDALGEDCDDTDPSVYPDAPDICGDGIDSNCDRIGGPDADEDVDGLTFNEELELGTSDCSHNEVLEVRTQRGCNAAPMTVSLWALLPLLWRRSA